MTSLTKLKAVNKSIIFTFLEDTTGGMFNRTLPSGLIVRENADKQLKEARWGKVVKLGPNVEDEDVKEGTYVLVEALQWTTHNVFEGEKFWVTNIDKILAVSDEKPKT